MLPDANEAVLMLRQHGAWAWAVGVALVWADLFLPVPQASVIAALGIVYGVAVGGLLGSVALVTGGLLGYALMRSSARRLVLRWVVGARSLQGLQAFFERAGEWAIALTRSLPYSIPEVLVCLAGLAGMPARRFMVSLCLGSVPTAFLYAWIGSGLAERPVLALAISYALPLACLPPTLHWMRRRGWPRNGASSPSGGGGR